MPTDFRHRGHAICSLTGPTILWKKTENTVCAAHGTSADQLVRQSATSVKCQPHHLGYRGHRTLCFVTQTFYFCSFPLSAWSASCSSSSAAPPFTMASRCSMSMSYRLTIRNFSVSSSVAPKICKQYKHAEETVVSNHDMLGNSSFSRQPSLLLSHVLNR